MTGVAEALLIAALFGVLFLGAVDNQLLIPILPKISRDLEIPVQTVSRLFSIYALSAAFFNLILGPLTDRYGRVPFLRVGLVAFVLLGLAAAYSRSYADLIGIRALAGIAAGLLSTCTAGLVGDYFPYRRRGRVMGIVLMSYFAALILGLPLGAWVAEQWEWRAVFLCTAGLAGILLLPSLLVFPAERPKERAQRRAWRNYVSFLRGRATRSGIAASFLISGATLALLTFISAHLDASFGVSAVQISWLFIVSGVGALIASPVAGWLSDSLGKRRVFLAGNTLLVFPLLVLHRIPWGVGLGLVFLSISLLVAARQTALQTIQTELIPGHQRGAFLSLRNGASQLGISFAVFAAGFLFSSYGYAGVTALAAVLTLAASLLVFAALPEEH